MVLLCSQNYAAGFAGATTNPQIDLNLPKQNPYLHQANQKILPNFPTQKIAESNPKSPRWLSRLFNPGVLYPISLLLHGPLTSPDRLKRYRNHTKYGTVSGSLWRRSSRLETSSSRPSYKGKSSQCENRFFPTLHWIWVLAWQITVN